MTEAEELAKARLHNQQARQRGLARTALKARLSGDPAAAKAVNDAWSPVVKASQERGGVAGGDPCR